MARIDVLPSIEIIRGLKGVLDFYVWRGLACVRAWPRYRPATQSPASLAAALIFGAIVRAYNQMGEIALDAYKEDALDQPRTARDIYVTSQYGNLHEATMSDFLDALIIIRDSVVALTDLLHALDSVDTDQIVVNVDQSVLPAGASTLGEQQTQTTALQLIDDLNDALESNALDRLLVRGMDQLFSYKDTFEYYGTGNPSGDNGYAGTTAVPAGELWILTNAVARDRTRPLTAVQFARRAAGVDYYFATVIQALAANDMAPWTGLVPLDPGDRVRIWFLGSLAADTVDFWLTGYRMTLET